MLHSSVLEFYIPILVYMIHTLIIFYVYYAIVLKLIEIILMVLLMHRPKLNILAFKLLLQFIFFRFSKAE